MPGLVSERIGQFFVEGHGARDRLEYTEYGAGDAWVVLLHGQLMPRRMHQPLARALAAEGLHVVTLDLLGHGRSDRPADPHAYSVTAFAEQVVALLDHLGAPQAVVGGTSLGANVSLEVAAQRARAGARPDRRDAGAQQRGRGRDPRLRPADVRRPVPAVHGLRAADAHPPGAARRGAVLGRHRPRHLRPAPGPMAAVVHGMFFGRVAPSSQERRAITAPALVVGHPKDPIHPAADAAMLAEELPHATFLRARSILEWRIRPERLDRAAAGFALGCWATPARQRGRQRRTSG